LPVIPGCGRSSATLQVSKIGQTILGTFLAFQRFPPGLRCSGAGRDWVLTSLCLNVKTNFYFLFENLK
jgi:hypothetical protein